MRIFSPSLSLRLFLSGPDRSHWRRIEVWELCARTYRHVRHTYSLPPLSLTPVHSRKKIGRVSALPGINLSGVVAGSAGRSRRSLCARAAIRHSIKPNSIHRPIDLFSQRGRVRYQLPSRQRKQREKERERVANGNRKSDVW